MLGDRPPTAKTKVLSGRQRKLLCSQFGPSVTKIAITALADDHPTHAQIAKRVRSSRRAVQRALKLLHDAGWITSERSQHGCIYRLSDAPNGASEPLRSIKEERASFSTPISDGEGSDAASPLHIQQSWGDRRWLLWMFEAYVAPTSRYKITDKRRQGWSRGAVILLREHPLCEVARVLSGIFDEYGGVFPFAITREVRNRRGRLVEVKTSSKFTSLYTLVNHWDEARAWFPSLAGAPSGGPPEGTP
jgi:hypothetical protein